MNWLGDLIQKNIDENDTVLDLGCGIMQATLDVIPSYPKTRLKCKRLFGVDIHQPYLDFLNDLGIETLKWDLRDVPLPFKDKSYDVILMTDILEHLPHIEYVNKLIYESSRIARKIVFVLTPNKFFNNESAISNPYPYEMFEENNKYQKHQLLIKRRYLEDNGFKVINIKRIHQFAIKKLFNKILHVWDCAGVSGILSKYQNKMGYESKVFIGNKVDTYGFDDFYDEVKFKIKKSNIPKILKPKTDSIISKIYRHLRYYNAVKKYINSFDPDIIHFHALEFIPLLFPFRKKIIEFHGTRLRRKWANGSINENVKTPQWIFSMYKLLDINCLYSTTDLKEDIPSWIDAEYLPNPVDIEHFKSEYKGINNLALYSKNSYEDKDKRLSDVKETFKDLEVCVLNRVDNLHISYKKMPDYLSYFEYYIDRSNIKSLSKTALESLSMGLKVIDWKNDIIEGLPSEHDPYNVARKTLEIYNKIMDDQL